MTVKCLRAALCAEIAPESNFFYNSSEALGRVCTKIGKFLSGCINPGRNGEEGNLHHHVKNQCVIVVAHLIAFVTVSWCEAHSRRGLLQLLFRAKTVITQSIFVF